MTIFNKSNLTVHVWFYCGDCFSPGWWFIGAELDPGRRKGYANTGGTLIVQYTITDSTSDFRDPQLACQVDPNGWGEVTVIESGNSSTLVLTTYDENNGKPDCTESQRFK